MRASVRDDIKYISDNLRENDIKEIWASDNILPLDALAEGFNESIACWTISNGNPIAMFGIVPETVLGNKACVWLLATDGISDIRRRFARRSREFIKTLHEWYPYLYNYVDDRNKDSIAWLKFCGAKINEPEEYGVERMPFRYFYFEKQENKNV